MGMDRKKKMWSVPSSERHATEPLDLESRRSDGSEMGLLGVSNKCRPRCIIVRESLQDSASSKREGEGEERGRGWVCNSSC